MVPEGSLTAKRIWEKYKRYMNSSFTVRYDYQSFGMCQEFYGDWFYTDLKQKRIFEKRGQSNGEHQANLSILVNFFASNYPSFFGLRNTLSLKEFPYIWVISTLALIHACGESGNEYIFEDNPIDRRKWAKRELDAICDFAEGFNKDDEATIVEGAKLFLGRRSFYKALYALEQFEEVLTLIYLESLDIKGDVFANNGIYELRQKFVQYSGSTNPVDCLAARFKFQMKKAKMPDYITEPLYDTLFEAIMDVRNEFFPWWDKPMLPNRRT